MEIPDTIGSALIAEMAAKLEERLSILAPMVAEHNEVQAAHDRLLGRPSITARHSRPADRIRTETTGRRGRPRGSGSRSGQVLDLLAARPGLTTSELADALGIKANYLYRVLPQMQTDGQITKNGSGYFVADGASEPVPPTESEPAA